MTPSEADLRRIERLARLRLGAEEELRLGRDVERILGYVESLAELGDADVASVEPGPAGRGQHPGETVPESDGMAHAAERLAPEWGDGLFLVPPPTGVTPEGS